MNQNQCVPSWDIDDVGPTIQPPPSPPLIIKSFMSNSQSTSISTMHDISTQDYEIAELAWENGQLTMHGLGLPRTSDKNNLESACGTLESLVNQATHVLLPPLAPIGACDLNEDLVPLYNPKSIPPSPTPREVSVATDALVPNTSSLDVLPSKRVEVCSTRVGSCSGVAPSVTMHSDWSVSVSARGSGKWRSVKRGANDTCQQLKSMTNGEIASTSFCASLDTTNRTVTINDHDHDSVCHKKYQREKADDEDNRKKEASSTKRSRKAAVHNQSERKRRDKINQKMKTLQKLVPNSNKTDKASMLDEVIDYLKQLQAQLQMLNTMRSPSMLMPLAIQQQQQQLLQMYMMASMGMGYGIGQPNISGIPNIFLNPSSYTNTNTNMNATTTTNGADCVIPQPINTASSDPMSMYLASQSHSITMDAYTKIASMYQQLLQQQESLNQNSDDK